MALPSLLTRATAAVDRQVLRFMERRMRGGAPRAHELGDARARLIELAARYGDGTLGTPSGFFPAPAHPDAVVETRAGDHAIDLRFPSTYVPFVRSYADEHERWRENLHVHARLHSSSRHGGGRPVLVLIHGWGGGAYWLEERAFVVPYWLRQGFDVALAQLPFHGARAPRVHGEAAARSGALFPSPHLVRTNEAFGQAIHDLRALAAWLRRRGAPAIGAMGMSLGGYTTALWSTIAEPERGAGDVAPTGAAGAVPPRWRDALDFAIAMIPAVSMSDLMWRHGAHSPARLRAEKAGVSGELLDDVFRVHAPTTRPPLPARERLMIVAGAGDRITPPDHAETLRAHWGGCAIHWFPGGHLAQVGRGDAFRAVRRHLDALDLPGRGNS